MSDEMTPAACRGVVFADEDYAGLIQRLGVHFVDGAALALGWIICLAPGADPAGNPSSSGVFIALLLSYVYLAILKPSRIRTLGLRLTGLRMVDHRGQCPSVLRMTFRLPLWLLGPLFHPFVDLIWLTSDRHRQTLRDRFVGTYVVRAEAESVSSAHRRAAYCCLLGYVVIFWELQPDPPMQCLQPTE
ncbi:MAG: RDD family protein [Planctomycetota bacterium]